MSKQEAIEKMVGEFNSIPQDWIDSVCRDKDEPHTLPMWGWMWLVEDWVGEKLMTHSRLMAGDNESIDTEEVIPKHEKAVKKALRELKKEEIDWAGCAVLEQYVDEEMAGERCIVDKDGNATAVYIYEIDGRYVIGVNGAGWSFYDGVWDRIYDLLGYEWHEDEDAKEVECVCPGCGNEHMTAAEDVDKVA